MFIFLWRATPTNNAAEWWKKAHPIYLHTHLLFFSMLFYFCVLTYLFLVNLVIWLSNLNQLHMISCLFFISIYLPLFIIISLTSLDYDYAVSSLLIRNKKTITKLTSISHDSLQEMTRKTTHDRCHIPEHPSVPTKK